MALKELENIFSSITEGAEDLHNKIEDLKISINEFTDKKENTSKDDKDEISKEDKDDAVSDKKDKILDDKVPNNKDDKPSKKDKDSSNKNDADNPSNESDNNEASDSNEDNSDKDSSLKDKLQKLQNSFIKEEEIDFVIGDSSDNEDSNCDGLKCETTNLTINPSPNQMTSDKPLKLQKEPYISLNSNRELTIIFDFKAPEKSKVFFTTDLEDIAEDLIYLKEEADFYQSNPVFCIINGKLIDKSIKWEEIVEDVKLKIKEDLAYQKDIKEEYLKGINLTDDESVRGVNLGLFVMENLYGKSHF